MVGFCFNLYVLMLSMMYTQIGHYIYTYPTHIPPDKDLHTEALEYHGSSFLFPPVIFVSRDLFLFSASYFCFPQVIFGFRELFLVSAS